MTTVNGTDTTDITIEKTLQRKPRQKGRAVPAKDEVLGIEPRIRARIEELKQEQATFIQQAQARVDAYATAIGELERALAGEKNPVPPT